MKGKDFLKLLKKDGWTLDRITGSHHIMVKGNKTVSVPVTTKDLKKGTFSKLIKETGVKGVKR